MATTLDLISRMVSTRRVIDSIRKKLGGKWRYRHGEWRCEDGRVVYCCAALSPRYDGDDDTFRREYWLRLPSGSCERFEP